MAKNMIIIEPFQAPVDIFLLFLYYFLVSCVPDVVVVVDDNDVVVVVVRFRRVDVDARSIE